MSFSRIMSVHQHAIFTGANKQAHVADYSEATNVIAFGAGNNVALWRPLDQKGVFATLKRHTKEVTGVRFVPHTDVFVSTGEDGLLNVWRDERLVQSIDTSSGSITALAVGEKLVVTGSSAGNISIYRVADALTLLHTFEVRSGYYPLSLALQNIEPGVFVLAVGGTSSHLYIYSFLVEAAHILHFQQAAAMTGHEDWIKALAFVQELPGNYLLASGCQDRYIRLWRLRLNDLIDDSDEDDLKLVLLSNKQYKFEYGRGRAAFNFEALIMGHDDWVTDLRWHPAHKRQLLSSSADTALMVWEMDEDSGIWCCVNRLGELSIKGASTATGASGGFWLCLWFVDGDTQYIVANGKTGSFRVYRSIDKQFEPVRGPTGPNREATDVVWARNGQYFQATSLDQTTRLFAPFQGTWHEFARPQIHGYDMVCLDNLSDTKFVSGGDEKILRVFEMTNSTSKLLKDVCRISVDGGALPDTASLPVLGLSNKAGNDDAAREAEEEVSENDVIAALDSPPLEDHLQRYTLFPEVEKLYGHGYEITCVATLPSGLIASACRSNSAKHAVIRVFNSNEYQQEHVLEGHLLTITSLEFSPDGRYLLAVSRDRALSVWDVDGFQLVELKQKAHTRIIWDCSWASNNTFVTGSRDKNIKLWRVDGTVELVASIKLADAVTSVATYRDLVATGFESGAIEIYRIAEKFELAVKFDDRITPSGKITKLAFSSVAPLLAVASADTSVRMYQIE